MSLVFSPGKENRCSVHFEEITRGILGPGEEVVYVLC